MPSRCKLGGSAFCKPAVVVESLSLDCDSNVANCDGDALRVRRAEEAGEEERGREWRC